MSNINQTSSTSHTPEPRKNKSGSLESGSPGLRKAPGQRKQGLLSGQVSVSTCVRTLSQITISRRGLLNLEMAVGLAVFLDAGKADRTAKGMLMEIYAKAGYECATSNGKDYKTVNRRIGAASGLFGKLGLEVINHWVDECKERGETKVLNTLAQRLVELNFGSLDDVLDYAGRTSNRTAAKGDGKDAKAGAGEGAVAGSVAGVKSPWDIPVGDPQKPVVIHIPVGLGEAELIELASKILALAETVKDAAQRGAEGPTEPTAGVAPERRLEAVAVEQERRSA